MLRNTTNNFKKIKTVSKASGPNSDLGLAKGTIRF